ncbi:MAG: LptF/LptG family permease [Bacteroidales bacterium]|nr:LptF/LptG family permease [Bacteroidales bacterium]
MLKNIDKLRRLTGLTIIDLYIIRKFLGTFFYSIALLISVVIIFDISEKIDDFIDKQAPLSAIIFDYYLNFIPFFINLFSALFTFISVVFFTSRLAARTEIIAILSSGISFRRLLRPYIIAASFLVILTIYLANFLIPVLNIDLREFEKKYIKNPIKTRDIDIHMQISPGTFMYVESWDNSKNQGTRFSLEQFERGRMISKITSDRITWDTASSHWQIHDYILRTIDSMNYQTLTRGKILDTAMTMNPAEFVIDVEDIKTMNYSQLRNFIDRETLKGSKNIKVYEVEKYKRIAFPVSALILTIIGVALSSRKIRGGIGMHLGLGIALTFSYILFMQISSQFAIYGSLQPMAAVWMPNLFFGIIAVWLLKIAPK